MTTPFFYLKTPNIYSKRINDERRETSGNAGNGGKAANTLTPLPP